MIKVQKFFESSVTHANNFVHHNLERFLNNYHISKEQIISIQFSVSEYGEAILLIYEEKE